MLNWLMRYQAVVAYLEHAAASSALEVGGGWHGLSWYWSGDVTQTDVCFEVPPHDEGRAGRARFLRCTAQQLPFADDSFDYAVSLDMVEHLPEDIRASSVRELTRVARRGVLIAFPVGVAAARFDRTLARAHRVLRRPTPPWLEEHLAQESYPDAGLVARALPSNWAVVDVKPLGNVVAQGAVVIGEMLPGSRRLLGALESRYRSRSLPRWLDAGPTSRLLFVVEPRG